MSRHELFLNKHNKILNYWTIGCEDITVNLTSLSSAVSMTFVLCAVSPVWAETPTTTIKNLLDAVRAYKTVGTAASVRKTVEDTLPLQDLSKEVLGPHWAKLNAAEQKNFVQ